MEWIFSFENTVPWIILLPLAGALINGVAGRKFSRKVVEHIAVGAMAVAFLLALMSFGYIWMLDGIVVDAAVAKMGGLQKVSDTFQIDFHAPIHGVLSIKNAFWQPFEGMRILIEGGAIQLAGSEVEPVHQGALLTAHVYEWFSLKFYDFQVPVFIRFTMDALSGLMTLVVTGIGLLIHIYSKGYMSEEKSYARFFTYLNLFSASMLILVLASNLPLMFVGWEGVGLCSYLLIGFWWENPAYAAAGRKAFIANRIGDFGVLIGMFLLVSTLHTFEFSEISRFASLASDAGSHTLSQVDSNRIASLLAPFSMGSFAVGTVATLACLFLFLGCTGKSAQIPLYVWLPDAMAGPTPVSALIHAATMVTSGVYLCSRLSNLFLLSNTAMMVIAVVGAVTALVAASIALVQNEMKKVLAYSTVSQLGFMFAAVGVGAFVAGFFHVFTHAFFKACLFLGAGSVMHAVGAHGDADMRKLGGLRSILPKTHWTFLVSCMAIAGVPLTSGFFSKDEILLGATRLGSMGESYSWVGWFVFVALVLAATMTAFYMFRLYFRTFTGTYRSAKEDTSENNHEHHDHGYDAHPHESPNTMTIPLAILGVGALIVGYLNLEPLHVHFNAWGDWLKPVVSDIHGGAGWAPLLAMAGGFSAMAIGIGLAWKLYKDKEEDILPERIPAKLHSLLMDKWRVNEFYAAVVLKPIRALAKLSEAFDRLVVDGVLTKLTSLEIKLASFGFTRIQTGKFGAYGLVLLVGVFFVAWWFVYPHPVIEKADVRGANVRFIAAQGPNYEYRWDFDGDGEYDTYWSKSSSALHRYTGNHFPSFALVVGPERERLPLHSSSPQALPISPSHVEINSPGAFAILKDDGVLIRPNGYVLKIKGRITKNDEILVKPGDKGLVAGYPFKVVALIAPKLTVRNSFGNLNHTTLELEVMPSKSHRIPARKSKARTEKSEALEKIETAQGSVFNPNILVAR